MKKLLLTLLVFTIATTSCKKKEYPQNVTEEPTFFISATIDGVPLTFKAGTFGYYMHSSYVQDTNGVYRFVAEVKPGTCGNACPNSLKIELNDNQASPIGGSSNINNSIKVAEYLFVNTSTVTPPTIIGYSVAFKSSYNKTAANYNWNFNYGSASSLANPSHTYATAGVYNTKFEATESSSVTSTTYIENPIKVTTSPYACKTRILASSGPSNTIQFSHVTEGSGNYLFRWEFGDGNFSSSSNPTHTYAANGRYLANLRVIDNNYQDTAYHNYYVNAGQSQLATPNFYAHSVTPILSNSILSKVKISYTDAGGKTYSSNLQAQTASTSNFQIVSVEEYKVNENNQFTKKLRIKFNCKLFDGSNSVSLSNGEAVIAVAYR